MKYSFLGLRFGTRIIVGRKTRNKIFLKKKLDFKGFIIKIIGSNNLIKCDVTKYEYGSYCRTTHSLNDLIIMTIHEDDMLNLFYPKEGDIVVDVGSCLGRYTLSSSKRVGKKGKVIAIDGDPSNIEMLNRNLQLNKTSNVTVLNYVVDSTKKQVNYQQFLKRDLFENEKKFDKIKINCDTLDNLLIKECRIDEVNWIKIDVEGAELEVLKSSHNILTNSTRLKIQVEIHGVNKLYKPIVELLHSYNFKIIFEKDEDSYRHGDRIGAKQIIAEKISN
jgi:FkbM family methyltransferase